MNPSQEVVKAKNEVTAKSITVANNIKALKDRGFDAEALHEGLALYLSYQVPMPSMELQGAGAVSSYFAQSSTDARQLLSEANEVCVIDARAVLSRAERFFATRHSMAFTPERAALAIGLLGQVSEESLHAFNQFTQAA